MSSSPTPEPENSHFTSAQEASQSSSEAASIAAEDSVAQTPSTRVDAAKEYLKPTDNKELQEEFTQLLHQ